MKRSEAEEVIVDALHEYFSYNTQQAALYKGRPDEHKYKKECQITLEVLTALGKQFQIVEVK